MREYHLRRTGDNCPTGKHVVYSPDPNDPNRDLAATKDCDCPWLIIRDCVPGGQSLVWPTKESLLKLIAKFSEGYFDVPGVPPRTNNEFVSPYVAQLLEAMQEKDLVGAAMQLMGRVTADRVHWSPTTATLSLRIPFDHGSGIDTWIMITFKDGESLWLRRGTGDDLHPHGVLLHTGGLEGSVSQRLLADGLSEQVAALLGETGLPTPGEWLTAEGDISEGGPYHYLVGTDPDITRALRAPAWQPPPAHYYGVQQPTGGTQTDDLAPEADGL